MLGAPAAKPAGARIQEAAAAGAGRMAATAPQAKTGLRRTITGSQMDLGELDSIINGASCRSNRSDHDGDASSIASSSHLSRSNIVQVKPGARNVKAALAAALAEAAGCDDPSEPPVAAMEGLALEPDESGYDMTSPNTPRASMELKHNHASEHPSAPLEGAGAAKRTYSESSAPPEGAGGYSCGAFVEPVVEEPKPPAQPRAVACPAGLQRTVTGGSLRPGELAALVEKAGEAECPATPSSAGGRTPRSQSAWSLASGRTGSIVQVQPGAKDIRAALAAALADGGEPGSGTHSPTGPGSAAAFAERQGLALPASGPPSGLSTPLGGGSGGGSGFGGGLGGGGGGGGLAGHRPRSIRRLMSEKSFTMDTVYSGMVLDSDLPSEPLEGAGLVEGRRYQEPKHGPQGASAAESPRDFPRVVNGVPTASAGDEEAAGGVPASPPPLRKAAGGPHRTVSGSQMDLAELATIMERATVPRSERTSFDSRAPSSTGVSTATHRTVRGAGLHRSRNQSQVFGEEIAEEPTQTFGRGANSLSKADLQALIDGASVPRPEPASPRDSLSSVSIANEA